MIFFTAIDRLLKNEGGYVNDPADPGGETQWGISKRSYPAVDIKGLTRVAAIEIYRTDFWLRVHADSMADLVAFQAIDFAVNSGIETTVRKLQAAVGVADDGYWGPITQAAVGAMKPAELGFRFLAERLDYMRRLSKWQTFGRGWAGRIAADMRYAADDLLRPRGLNGPDAPGVVMYGGNPEMASNTEPV